ncbi:MAG TPA: hypothetical protein VMT16_09400, partial [Thermoanaerobaculia bacterium]|nr:hypothetical protein [Thermoanaerobaculia bacterium]
MNLDRRQRAWLAALGGVLLLALVVRAGDGGEGDQRSSRQARRGGPRAAPVTTQVVPLDLERLEPRSERFELGRDPFRYGVIEAPPPPPPPP